MGESAIFCTFAAMFIRKRKNPSGSITIAAVVKRHGKPKEVKIFGTATADEDIDRLYAEAQYWSKANGNQLPLDFDDERGREREETARVVDNMDAVLLNGTQLLLNQVYDRIGFSRIPDEILRHLVIARVSQPRSKLATVAYLKSYYDEDTDLNHIYRYMDKLYNTQKELVQQISVEHTRKILGGKIGLMFYDVTTLYFETSKTDVLREPGFSKDGEFFEYKRENGDRLIVGYSDARAKNDAYNRTRGVERLRKAYKSGKLTKEQVNRRGYNKFLEISKDVEVSINQEKIDEDSKWDGLKGYVTNTDLAAGDAVNEYKGLWVVERAFRVGKGTLDMRPMFHFTERRIEAHVCICFVAYKVYKELERIIALAGVKLSVDKVLEIAKTITTIRVNMPQNHDVYTKTLFLSDEQNTIKPLFNLSKLGAE